MAGANDQFPIYTSNRHVATLPFIWSRVSGHSTDDPLVHYSLRSPLTPEGKYMAVSCKMRLC